MLFRINFLNVLHMLTMLYTTAVHNETFCDAQVRHTTFMTFITHYSWLYWHASSYEHLLRVVFWC